MESQAVKVYASTNRTWYLSFWRYLMVNMFRERKDPTILSWSVPAIALGMFAGYYMVTISWMTVMIAGGTILSYFAGTWIDPNDMVIMLLSRGTSWHAKSKLIWFSIATSYLGMILGIVLGIIFWLDQMLQFLKSVLMLVQLLGTLLKLLI